MDVLGYHPGHLLSKFLLEIGLHQHVIAPKRDTSILDLVLTDNPVIISDVHVTANFSTTDHASVLFNLSFVENLKHKQVIYTLNFKKANWAGMHDMLASINCMADDTYSPIVLISRHDGIIFMILYDKLYVASHQLNELTPLGVLNEGLYQ